MAPGLTSKTVYLGLKFQIKGKTHYGWARLNVEVSKTTITATLTGYAYETIPNKPILAGKTSRPEAARVEASSAALGIRAPQPGTLSLLA